jgi:hypothetical protein
MGEIQDTVNIISGISEAIKNKDYPKIFKHLACLVILVFILWVYYSNNKNSHSETKNETNLSTSYGNTRSPTFFGDGNSIIDSFNETQEYPKPKMRYSLLSSLPLGLGYETIFEITQQNAGGIPISDFQVRFYDEKMKCSDLVLTSSGLTFYSDGTTPQETKWHMTCTSSQQIIDRGDTLLLHVIDK